MLLLLLCGKERPTCLPCCLPNMCLSGRSGCCSAAVDEGIGEVPAGWSTLQFCAAQDTSLWVP